MIDDYLSYTENLADDVNITLKRYKDHPSIVTISFLVTKKDNFSFT